jgi:DNA-binding GntR family transcriptional regulator
MTTAEAIPVHERVYRRWRQRILDGALAPGDAVTVRGIADALSVSMTPAREAARRLVAERALEMTATGRLRVPVLDDAALSALFAARALLEPELAARALPRADRALLRRLKLLDEAVEAALATGQPGSYVRANTAFHAALYAAAGAPSLMALVESVWLQLAPAMRVVTGREGTKGLADYHAEAMTALATGDEAALRAAIAADVAQAQALVARTVAAAA